MEIQITNINPTKDRKLKEINFQKEIEKIIKELAHKKKALNPGGFIGNR